MEEPLTRTLFKIALTAGIGLLVQKNWGHLTSLSTTVPAMLEVRQIKTEARKIDVIATPTQTIFDVQSTPAGADILVDGKSTTYKTPARLRIKVGTTVRLSIRIAGYEGCDVLVDSRTPSVNCQLRK